MARNHIIVSGTGRAGTTFLMQLFTHLGLDTGFTDCTTHVDPTCHGGMEACLWAPDAPYIVKSPLLCDFLDRVVRGENLIIDHAILPVRDLFAAAESRRDVVRRTGATGPPSEVIGGLLGTDHPEAQEQVLCTMLYRIIYALAKCNIPLTLLDFPRLATDPAYLFAKLSPIFPQVAQTTFDRSFRAVCRPDLIHDFRARQSAAP